MNVHPLLLIVQDNAEKRARLRKYAGLSGFLVNSIEEAGSEEEAYAKISNSDYEMALIDLRLREPDSDWEGLRVISRLRASQPLCRILGITRDDTGGNGVKMIRAGAHDFISENWEDVNWVDLLVHRLRLWREVIRAVQASQTSAVHEGVPETAG